MFGIEGISANLIYDVAIKSYSIFNQKKLLEKIIKKSAKKSGIPNRNIIRNIEKYIIDKGLAPNVFTKSQLSHCLGITEDTSRIFLNYFEAEISNNQSLFNWVTLEYLKNIRIIPDRHLIKFPEILKSPKYETANNLFSNDLIFLTSKEIGFQKEIISIISDPKRPKCILISGDPTSGKTIFSFSIANKLLNQNYIIYFCNITSQITFESIYDEIRQKDEPKTIFVFDNCHFNIGLISHVFDRMINFNFSKFIFISPLLSKENRKFEQLNNLDIFENLSDVHFKLHFKDSKNTYEKIKGIVNKFKDYYYNQNGKSLVIGEMNRVIGNVSSNLLTLHYNLKYWPREKSLDFVNKHLVLKNIYNEYFNSISEALIAKVACINQFEIPYEANENELIPLQELSSKGLLHYDNEEGYFYFYHPDFAKLLVKAYLIRPKFKRLQTNFENFVYSNLQNYLLDETTQFNFLDLVYFNLILNHKFSYIIKFLSSSIIFKKSIDFFQTQGTLEKLLFLLHSLKEHNFKIVKKIIKEIPDDTWLKKLNNFGIAGFTFSLICLKASNPEKAKSLLLSVPINVISKKVERSNIKLITNSLIELNKISPKDSIGTKLYNELELIYLTNLLKKSNFIHIGKSLSELSELDPEKTKLLLDNIPNHSIIEKAKKANLKAITKSLNELNKIDPQLCNTISSYFTIAFLKEKIKKSNFEGIGRSLNEYWNIDQYKTKRVFNSIPTEFWIAEAKNNTLLQIGKTLRELISIDEYRVKKIYFLIDDELLRYKITDPELTFSQICDGLHLLHTIDKASNKTNKLFIKNHLEYFIKKIRQSDFHSIAIGLYYLHLINPEFVKNLLKLLDINIIIKKSFSCAFKSLGESLLKFRKVDYSLFNSLLIDIDFDKKIKKGPSLRLDEIANSLNDLHTADNLIGKKVYNNLDIEILIKSSQLCNKSSIIQAVSKLKKVDYKKTNELRKLLN